MTSKEQLRLENNHQKPVPQWQKWGPYVSERSWGTVREDYSDNGDAWNYFTHDQAVFKTYRWGDDAIAGWCDRYQVLLFAPVFWNGKDDILKERLFGLSSEEGNHGEDVKEYYYHLDATPTHSYMKYLYKYPQDKFPYETLRHENRHRSGSEGEYELVDTQIFSNNNYFDIFIEYAKPSPEDLCIRIEVFNRGNSPASLHILPHLWFRNQWSWGDSIAAKPQISVGPSTSDYMSVVANDTQMLSPQSLLFDYHLGERYLYGPLDGDTLFTNNETRFPRSSPGYYKDGFHRAIIHHETTVNPDKTGTKACFHYHLKDIPAQSSTVLLLRLTDKKMQKPLQDIEKIIANCKKEADAFYAEIQPKEISADEKAIQRQALAGILWNKQIYLFDVETWLKGDNTYYLPPASRYKIRNMHWEHLNSMRILLMPDKWEYPYFCAWDQVFHCVTLGLVDIELAKEELLLLLFDQFQHPNGQIPACEWDFSQMNPPIHAWAALQLYFMEKQRFGKTSIPFLKECFHKLILNFVWWTNKVDSSGHNIFEGGFLGLDNITLFDRSQKFPGGAKLQQSDGSGWMAMFCLNLMRIALEIAKEDPTYEAMATKFFQHFVYIAHAIKRVGHCDYELWSNRDRFFYDVLTYPDGHYSKLRIRSLVGIIPLYAVEVLDEDYISQFPEFEKNFKWFLNNRKELTKNCVLPAQQNHKTRFILSLVNKAQLEGILEYVWSPEEFRSPYGLRSLSKFHEKNPFEFDYKKVGYEPAESLAKIIGGNSNWRGPIWFPTMFLLIDALKKYADGFQDEIKIKLEGEETIGLEAMVHLFTCAQIRLFIKDENGNRPFLGENFPFQKDPDWCNYFLFYEYFNPETGKGLGASHQAGWTALIANLINTI